MRNCLERRGGREAGEHRVHAEFAIDLAAAPFFFHGGVGMERRSFTSSLVRDEASASLDPRVHDDDPRAAQPELLRWLRARLRTPHDALRAAVFVLCGVLVLLQLRRSAR